MQDDMCGCRGRARYVYENATMRLVCEISVFISLFV